MKRIVLFAGALALGLGTQVASAADERTKLAEPPAAGLAAATFAAGCFWCVEPPFDKLDGVISTTSGYTGGHVAGATYKEVGRGGTGHTEAVRIVFDPKKVGYQKLVDTFWRNVDPLDAHGQFCDKGEEYRPAIFTPHTDEKRTTARKAWNRPGATPRAL